MRALTVQQPWAWAIIYGGKGVENRTRKIAGTYRGPVAIHAGKQWAQAGADSEPLQRAYAKWLGFDHWSGYLGGHTAMPIDPTDDRERELLDFGAFIGVVDLVGEHLSPAGSLCCGPWAIDGAVHLGVRNPRPLDRPIPCKGRLGLWTPPADVLDELRAMDLSATP